MRDSFNFFFSKLWHHCCLSCPEFVILIAFFFFCRNSYLLDVHAYTGLSFGHKHHGVILEFSHTSVTQKINRWWAVCSIDSDNFSCVLEKGPLIGTWSSNLPLHCFKNTALLASQATSMWNQKVPEIMMACSVDEYMGVD